MDPTQPLFWCRCDCLKISSPRGPTSKFDSQHANSRFRQSTRMTCEEPHPKYMVARNNGRYDRTNSPSQRIFHSRGPMRHQERRSQARPRPFRFRSSLYRSRRLHHESGLWSSCESFSGSLAANDGACGRNQLRKLERGHRRAGDLGRTAHDIPGCERDWCRP